MRIILPIILTFLSNVAIASNEAERYLSAMLNKYQSLVTYEDSGISITKVTSPDGSNFNDEFSFTTKYTDNNSLYFQWVKHPNEFERKLSDNISKPKTYSVWKDKTGIFSKYPFSEKTEYPNLANALSGATGISSGLAWMTPRFLSPDIPCPPNLGAKTSELLESNSNTIIIKQTHSTGGESKLYIDKPTYLLKKYEMKNKLITGHITQQVVVFNVKNAK